MRSHASLLAVVTALALVAAVAHASPATNGERAVADAPTARAETVTGLQSSVGYVEVLDLISGATQVSTLNTWSLYPDTDAGRAPRQPFTVAGDVTLHFVEAFADTIWASPTGLENVRVEIFSAAAACDNLDKTGDVLSVLVPVDDGRVSFTVSASNQWYKLYKIDISALGFVLPAGQYELSVIFGFCDGCGSFDTVVAIPNTAAPGFNGVTRYMDPYDGFTCPMQKSVALYRVLGKQAAAVCSPMVYEFYCAADGDTTYTWCVAGTEYPMGCAPGTGCEAGRSQNNPCTMRLDLQHTLPPPACGGSDGYICDADRPTEYYRCAGPGGGVHEGWMPCPPGTTCRATPYSQPTIYNPCW